MGRGTSRQTILHVTAIVAIYVFGGVYIGCGSEKQGKRKRQESQEKELVETQKTVGEISKIESLAPDDLAAKKGQKEPSKAKAKKPVTDKDASDSTVAQKSDAESVDKQPEVPAAPVAPAAESKEPTVEPKASVGVSAKVKSFLCEQSTRRFLRFLDPDEDDRDDDDLNLTKEEKKQLDQLFEIVKNEKDVRDFKAKSCQGQNSNDDRKND